MNNPIDEFKNEMYEKTKYYQKKYGFKIGNGKYDTWNNEADAFKHAYMQAVAQFNWGGFISGFGGYYHEIEGLKNNQPIAEANMDLWNNEIGREIGQNIRKFTRGKLKSEYPKEVIENMIAEEIIRRMKNGDLITNPKDSRSYLNKKLKIYEIKNLIKKFENFTGYAANLKNKILKDKIFTSEEIGNMSNDEFEDCEEFIDNQLKSFGIPNKFQADQEVKAGNLIWVNPYIREDGTEVSGYYRRK